ncbi:MAG: c-type cytochrome [Candidatus Latescibacteria bacterium]|nr:c-type cytochrome [Candidatus Latescibacterota bacterium]
MQNRRPLFFAPDAALALVLALLPAPSRAQRHEDEKPTNLKILPADISHEDLHGVMEEFNAALGVRCDHCHVLAPGKRDFASDEKEHKRAARGMMRLTKSINDSLGTLIGREEVMKVECVTCHRGQDEPRTLRGVLTATATKEGAEAAVKQYRELRDQYYGRGGYDFGENALLETAREMERRQLEPAVVLPLLRLNLELFPQSAGTHVQLGRVLLEQGDQAGATAHFEEAKRLQPDNRWLQRQIQEILKGNEGGH